MGIENVCCPNCGSHEQFGNVPMGLKLIRVESKRGKYVASEEEQSENKCTHCKETFYTITTRQQR